MPLGPKTRKVLDALKNAENKARPAWKFTVQKTRKYGPPVLRGIGRAGAATARTGLRASIATGRYIARKAPGIARATPSILRGTGQVLYGATWPARKAAKAGLFIARKSVETSKRRKRLGVTIAGIALLAGGMHVAQEKIPRQYVKATSFIQRTIGKIPGKKNPTARRFARNATDFAFRKLERLGDLEANAINWAWEKAKKTDWAKLWEQKHIGLPITPTINEKALGKRLDFYQKLWEDATQRERKLIVKAWLVDCAKARGLDPADALSLAEQESSFRWGVLGVKTKFDRAGEEVGKGKGVRAIGLCQIMPYTADKYEGQLRVTRSLAKGSPEEYLLNPFVNAEMMTVILEDYTKQTGSTANGVSAYFWSVERVNQGEINKKYLRGIQKKWSKYNEVLKNPEYYNQLVQDINKIEGFASMPSLFSEAKDTRTKTPQRQPQMAQVYRTQPPNIPRRRH